MTSSPWTNPADAVGAPAGPLAGVRIVEIAGMGPGPFAAMLLSDMGAEVVRVDRADRVNQASVQGLPIDFVKLRGRRSVAVDLKSPGAIEVVLRLVESSDAFIEGFRPGVIDRLGLGPDACRARNPKLVYAHVTGWGQNGPLAHTAGHDINYIALSGLLGAIGPAGGGPVLPLNLIGDYAGGGMLLAFAIACGLLEASRSGRGQVIDAAMLDGATVLGSIFHGMSQTGRWHPERGTNLLDGGAPFYSCYETADGKWLAVGAIETKFYAMLLTAIGASDIDAADQYDESTWAATRLRLASRFMDRTQAEWLESMAGLDTCVSPVLSLDEALEHPQNAARNRFVPLDGVLQAAPAPLFDRTPGRVQGGMADPGLHTLEVLSTAGFSDEELSRLQASGAIAQASGSAPRL